MAPRDSVIVYGIPNCDTVRRARAWLAGAGVEHRFHDFRRAGVPRAHLERWLAAVGYEQLVNRRGTAWRKLDEAERAAVTDAAIAGALLDARPSVIKRPVVEWPDGVVTVGFDAQAWALRAGALR